MSQTRKYKDHLNERLQDPSEAVGYLNAVLQEGDPRLFLLALRDVADAQEIVEKLNQEAKAKH